MEYALYYCLGGALIVVLALWTWPDGTEGWRHFWRPLPSKKDQAERYSAESSQAAVVCGLVLIVVGVIVFLWDLVS